MNILQRYRDWRKRKEPKPDVLAIGDTFRVAPRLRDNYSYDCDVFEATYISDPLVLAKRVASGSILRAVGEILSFDMTHWNWSHVSQSYIDAVNAATKGPSDAE